jgi:hypothetical protein
MNALLTRGLRALYPESWRARYGAEFMALLNEEPPDAMGVVNIVRWACYERARSWFEGGPANQERGLTLIVYASLTAMLAGLNLYWTIDDTPLMKTMDVNGTAFAFWRMTTWGAFITCAAGCGAALQISLAIARFAVANRRYDVLARLAFPPISFAILATWVWLVANRTHWAPTPWDITGSWVAPAHWPSLSIRWIFGTVTAIVLISGVIGSGVAVAQAINRIKLPESTFLHLTAIALASAIVFTAIGVAGSGFMAEVYAPATFHSKAGGAFGSPTILSWTASLTLFVGAAVVAVRGARPSAMRVLRRSS